MARTTYYAEIDARRSAAAVAAGDTRFKRMTRPFQHLACLLTAMEERGFMASAESGLPQRDGRPYPLLTWPFLDWCESRDLSALTLAEFGSGASTLWFASRFARIVAFETDAAWHARIGRDLPGNVEHRLLPAAELEAGHFEVAADVALIDCAANRLKLARRLLEKGAPPLVVLDNAEWYPNTARLLAGAGFHEIPFWGFKNGEDHESCTTLFVAHDATLPPRRDALPPPSAIAKPDNLWDRD